MPRVSTHLGPVRAAALLLLGTGLLLLGKSGAPAQQTQPKDEPPISRNRPIPVIDFRVAWNGMIIQAMHAEGNRPVQGRPTAVPGDLRYYYVPLMAFHKKPSGEVEVSAGDDGEIVLPIIYDSEAARAAVLQHLVVQKLIAPDAMVGQVQTVAAQVWYLETPPSYKPYVRFGPYGGEGTRFLFGRTDTLRTRVTPAEAQQFVRDLKTGQLSLQPTIVFDGYTYQDNAIVITANDVLNTEQFRKLSGQGGKGVVSRHQVARMAREACLTRSIAITTEYDDPDFAALVQALVQAVGEKEIRPVADWTAVESFFKEVGLDPRDLAPDLTEATKHIENKEHREQFAQEIEKHFKINASGSYGPFSASLGVETSDKNKVFKDVLDKWGVQTEWKGAAYLPKSVDVHTLNTASIRQATEFKVGKRKKTVSQGVLSWSINPKDNALREKAALAYEERLEELNRRAVKYGFIDKVVSSGVPAGPGELDGSPEGKTYRLKETFGKHIVALWYTRLNSACNDPIFASILTEGDGPNNFINVTVATDPSRGKGKMAIRIHILYEE